MADRPLSDLTKAEMLRIAAHHAEDYLRPIEPCLDLLAIEMGNHLVPTRDQVKAWAETAEWLRSLIAGEQEDLRGALAGEMPQPTAGAVE